MDRIVLWGATGQAKVLRECLGHAGVEVAALFDNKPGVASPFPGVPLYHGLGGLRLWMAEQSPGVSVGFLVAVGGDRGRERLQLQAQLEAEGLIPLTVRHPTAFIAGNAQIGPGSQVLANSAVCVEAVLGRGCIVNTAATVDHECRLGDGVHVCPGAHLAGCVEVGDCAMIGTGAVVLPRLRVGEGAVVGGGAVVLRDVPPDCIVVGNPARVLREKPRVEGA